MEWNVKNAMNRDVEREHLNKILKDIALRFEQLTSTKAAPTRPTYTPPVVQRPPLTVTLTGDVTGTATGSGSLTIETSLAELVGGLGDAPDDGSVYWRGNQQWLAVPLALQVLEQIEGEGLLALSPAGVFENREIVGVEDEIDVADGTGIDGNPTLSLADVPDVGGGELQKTEFDSKGRKIGTSAATTDDLDEGDDNLYFTDERAVDAVQSLLDEKLDYTTLKDTLVAGTNITLTPDDLDETITITSTGGGGGGGTIEAIIGGTGIEVDDTTPEAPVLSLSATALDSLALAVSAVQPADLALVATTGEYTDLLGLPTLGTMAAEASADYTPTAGLGSAAFEDVTFFATAAQGALAGTALQPGDNVSSLVNDAGYVDADEAALAAPVQSVNGKVGTVVLTPADLAAAPLGNPQFVDWVGIGIAADRPLIVNANNNMLGPGTASVIVTGNQNKERIETRSIVGDPTFQGKASNGTTSMQTAVNNGASLVTLAGSGHDGTTWVVGNRALIRARAAQDWTPTAQGADLVFATTLNGTTAFSFRWMINHEGGFSPMADNTYDLGSTSLRGRVAYFATGAINTSDAREKTVPRDMTSEEISCGLAIARLPSIFQWLESIAEKGEEAARLHVSPTVQDVIKVMQLHGLDPFRYSFVCYDTWPEQKEIVGEEGVIHPYRPAGDRYSLRPSGLEAFCRRALVADRDALEARLKMLENKG